MRSNVNLVQLTRAVGIFLVIASLMVGSPWRASGTEDADGVTESLKQRSAGYIRSGSPDDRLELLNHVQQEGLSKRTKAFGHFSVGMGDYRVKRYRDAAVQLELAADIPTDLADYRAYFLARSWSASGIHRQSAEVLSDFGRRFPDSRYLPEAVSLRIHSLLRAGDAPGAKEALAESSAWVTPAAAQRLAGEVEEALGEKMLAVRSYQKVYYEFPLSDEAALAEATLGRLRKHLGRGYPVAPPQLKLQRAETLFAAGKHPEAQRQYMQAVSVLKGPELELANLRIGVCDYHLKKTLEAYRWLSSLKTTNPVIAPEREYYMAECLRRANRAVEFARQVDTLGKTYADSQWYEKALYSAGNFFLLQNDAGRATTYFNTLVRSFPRAASATKAHWTLAWLAYRDQDPRARVLLEEHIVAYPDSPQVAAALYWRGRLAEAEQDLRVAATVYERLVEQYPNYFYAHRAQDQLRQLHVLPRAERARESSFLSLPPERPSIASPPTAKTSWRLRRAQLLESVGLRDLAQEEMRAADSQQADAYWLGLRLAEQASAAGSPHQGIRWLKRFTPNYLAYVPESLPVRFWQLLFPMPWEQELKHHARLRQLDPYLVAAVVRQESEFHPGAVSRAGARGLMQIMPSTGRMLASLTGTVKFTQQQLHSPEMSLQFGTLYLAKLLKQFESRPELALAAYNAGPSRVLKWSSGRNYHEPAEFVEDIPFAETRNYVQAVLRDAEIYRRVHDGLDKTPSLALQEDDREQRSAQSFLGCGACASSVGLPDRGKSFHRR